MRDRFDAGGFDECFDSSVDDVSGFDSFDTPEIDIETDFSDSSDILDDEFSGGVDEYLDNDIDVSDISTESFDENLSSEELLVDENFDTDLEDNFDMEDISEEAFDESFDTEDISEEDFADSFTMDDISDSDLDIDDTSEEEFSESDEFEETITEDFDSGFYDGTSLDEVPEDMQPYFANEYSEQEVENLNEDPLENEIEEETTDDVYEEVLNDNDVSEDYSSENIMEDENSVEQENDFDYEENLDEEIQQLEQGDFQEEISQVYSEDEIAQADADGFQNNDSFDEVSEAEDVVDSETIEVEKPTEELTPQQEMLNYYSEHNYGQMDYAEYSQDPEWQEINQRYIESLEHSEETSQGTPEEFQEEISRVYSEDEIAQADADELQNDDSFDVVSEAEDVVDSETNEVEEPTEELTPQQEMLNYYSEHNYGQMDYAEYSQDPEWQEINQRYIESLEHSEETSQGTPEELQEGISQIYNEYEIAQADADELQNNDSFNEVSEAEDVVDSETIEVEKPTEELTPQQEMLNYYSEHNYGQMDYAEYSQDPEWQEINQRYIESLEHFEETSQETPEEFQEGISQIYSEDEIAQADADELQNGPSYDIDSIESSSLSVDAVIENFDSEQGFNDTYEVPGSLNSFEGIDSDTFVREYDDFEQKVLSENPDFYETGQFYRQGVNDLGYEGTCGPTSQANAINTLLGTNEMTENKVLHIAVDNNLCEVGEISPADNGGTSTDQFMELYDKINEQIGDKLDIECFEYDNSLSVEQMAERLDEGAVLNVAVDSQTLWGENYHIPGTLGEDVYTDHWITVTGVNRNDVGDISSFNIIDSGGGVSEVSAETYDRMCFGESGRQMIDPTCIVVRKK